MIVIADTKQIFQACQLNSNETFIRKKFYFPKAVLIAYQSKQISGQKLRVRQHFYSLTYVTT